MATTESEYAARNVKGREAAAEYEYEKWRIWPVNWSAITVGALAALATALVISLIAIAVGAHLLGPEDRLVDIKRLGLTAMAFSIFGSFLAFVVGGWVAGKVAGILRSEPAMLHGAIVWLATVPVLALLASLGAGGYSAGWYAALGGNSAAATMPYERPEQLVSPVSEQARRDNDAAWAKYREDVARWREETPKATRNSALCAITALLLGLMGSVIGGWMASGEPMTLTYHLNRPRVAGRNQPTSAL
jgi:hypothetical protein